MDKNIFLKNLKISSQLRDVPNITEKNALFLTNLLRTSGSTRLLEVGTANGYSTLCFAFEIQKRSGHITTIEFSSEAYQEALRNFEQMGVDTMITALFGNALDILPTLQDTYDFIFIDAMKKHTLTFLLHCQKRIQKGGIIVIDDVIKFDYKMQDLYQYLEKSELAYQIISVDEDDGIIVIQY